MAEYKEGDKLIHYGHTDEFFTEGESYEVIYVDKYGVSVLDDDGDSHSLGFGFIPRYFELVTEPQPDVPERTPLFGRTPEVGDTVKLHISEECPEANGCTGVVTEVDEAGYFDVDIPSENYGGYTFVDPNTDVYEITKEPDKASDAVNSPDHYKRGKFETIEVIEEITQGYADGFVAHCAGTAIKYIARAPYKHDTPLEDLRKSAKYLEFAIKRLEAKL